MKVGMLTELIQNALQNDVEARKVGKQGSFALSAVVEEVTSVVNRLSEPLDVKGAEQAVRLTVLQAQRVADGVALNDNNSAKILHHGQYTHSVLFVVRLLLVFQCHLVQLIEVNSLGL